MELVSKSDLYLTRQNAPPLEENGLYFLWDKDKIVYVGQTTKSALSRILQHQIDKNFDAYTFLPVAPTIDLSLIEAEYIYWFSPKYNGQIPNHPRYKTRQAIQRQFGINGWTFRRLVRENGIRPNTMGHYDLHDFPSLRIR